jgi:hypothetical protein
MRLIGDLAEMPANSPLTTWYLGLASRHANDAHPGRLDVAANLKAESRRAGRPSREIVNETLRRGLKSRRVAARRRTFKATVRDLGNLKPGLSLDNIAELIEQVEGALPATITAAGR